MGREHEPGYTLASLRSRSPADSIMFRTEYRLIALSFATQAPQFTFSTAYALAQTAW